MANSRVICSYRGCTSNKNESPGKYFFKVPKDRCRLRLQEMGRDGLFNKPDNVIHNNTRICADHFLPSDFTSTLCTRLNPSALPIHTRNRNTTSGPVAAAEMEPLWLKEEQVAEDELEHPAEIEQIKEEPFVPAKRDKEEVQDVQEDVLHIKLEPLHAVDADSYPEDLPEDLTIVKNEISIPDPGSDSEEGEARLLPVPQCAPERSTPSQGEFVCEPCGKHLSNRRALRAHLRIHSGVRTHGCNLCEKTFLRKSHLLRHVGTHKQSLRCSVCEEMFVKSSELVRHVEERHGVVRRLHSCGLCRNVFTQSSSLATHLKIHSGERRFKCDTCTSAFSRKSKLLVHLRTHSGVRPYACQVCSKTFSQNCHLTEHQRIHSGARPFQCEVCGRTFSSKSSMSQHLKLHTGADHYYNCEMCGKVFPNKSNLARHIGTHS